MEAPLRVTILSAIGAGTIGSAVISAYVNRLMKNRDQLFEMSKYKMEVISKCMTIYAQLADYYDELSNHLDLEKPIVDIERAFFCASKILLLENTIFEKYGTYS